MDATVTGAVIGVGGACVGAAITAFVTILVQNREYQRKDEQTRRMVRQLYRNAFLALDGTMVLGYVDELERFQQVLELLLDRISKDDVTTAFPDQAATIISSIPQLLDGLHGCLRTTALQASDEFGYSDASLKIYAEGIRLSAAAALAMCGLVLQELGDKEFFNRNLSKVNAVRVLRFMDEEKDLKAQDVEGDKAEVEAYLRRTREAPGTRQQARLNESRH